MFKSFPKALLPVLFLTALAGCNNPVDDDEHIEAVGVVVTDGTGATIATYTVGSWAFASGDALHLHPGEAQEVEIFFVAPDGDRFQLPHSGAEHTLNVEVANPAVVEYHAHGDHGDFEAIAVGETTATIQLFHGGHADFETNPGLPIEVVDNVH